MHSFRETVASRARVAGESVGDIGLSVGQRDPKVTLAVYLDAVVNARRLSMRRSGMTVEFGGALRVDPDVGA